MITTSDTSKMKDMVTCVNQLQNEGYTEDFKISESGMMALQKEKLYTPEEIHVVNFFRFEGASDPADNAILYAIETDDGVKGTISDSYGAYADEVVSKFMEKVIDINKKA